MVLANVFEKVLEMNLKAAIVFAAVVIIRLLLKKAPKKWSYMLWAAVGFRLVCPVSFKSLFSIFTPLRSTGVTELAEPALPSVPALPVTPEALPPVTGNVPGISTDISAPVASAGIELTEILAIVWLAGIALMLAWGVVSSISLSRKLQCAVKYRDNIYFSDKIASPFVFGLGNPRIYLPFGLDEDQRNTVLAHEKAHLKRLDHAVKLVSYLLLCVHWFDPFVWIAFVLMGKDMEMSCDERVLKNGDIDSVRYSETLLALAEKKSFPSPCPIGFGESGVKARIKNALVWRRPGRVIAIAAPVLALAVLCACSLDPSVNEPSNEPEKTPEVTTEATAEVTTETTADTAPPETTQSSSIHDQTTQTSTAETTTEVKTEPVVTEQTGAECLFTEDSLVGDIKWQYTGCSYYGFEMTHNGKEYAISTAPGESFHPVESLLADLRNFGMTKVDEEEFAVDQVNEKARLYFDEAAPLQVEFYNSGLGALVVTDKNGDRHCFVATDKSASGSVLWDRVVYTFTFIEMVKKTYYHGATAEDAVEDYCSGSAFASSMNYSELNNSRIVDYAVNDYSIKETSEDGNIVVFYINQMVKPADISRYMYGGAAYPVGEWIVSETWIALRRIGDTDQWEKVTSGFDITVDYVISNY